MGTERCTSILQYQSPLGRDGRKCDSNSICNLLWSVNTKILNKYKTVLVFINYGWYIHIISFFSVSLLLITKKSALFAQYNQ